MNETIKQKQKPKGCIDWSKENDYVFCSSRITPTIFTAGKREKINNLLSYSCNLQNQRRVKTWREEELLNDVFINSVSLLIVIIYLRELLTVVRNYEKKKECSFFNLFTTDSQKYEIKRGEGLLQSPFYSISGNN